MAAGKPVEIVEVKPRWVAVVRAVVPFADLPRAQREARVVLAEALKTSGLEAGRPLTVWRRPRAGSMDYAPGVFVPDGFSPTGAVSLDRLPEGRAAHLRLRGSHTELPGAWQQLFAACSEQGLALAGLNWEIYGSLGAAKEEAGADLYALLD